MPEEIVLQLSHKDVNLGFFKSCKRRVLALRSGDPLRFEKDYFYAMHSKEPVCQLSRKMHNDLVLWEERGYVVSASSVRFVVAWRSKNAPQTEEESAILLIDMVLFGSRNKTYVPPPTNRNF